MIEGGRIVGVECRAVRSRVGKRTVSQAWLTQRRSVPASSQAAQPPTKQSPSLRAEWPNGLAKSCKARLDAGTKLIEGLRLDSSMRG